MPPTHDSHDPLELLLHEWSQVSLLFWVLLTAGAIALATLGDSHGPAVGVVLIAAAVGVPLLKLGPTLVIVGNEMRKIAPRSEDRSPTDPG